MARPRLPDRGTALRRAFDQLVKVHVAVYRRSGGRLANRYRGCGILLLDHAGRRSGRVRTLPLVYAERDGTLIVVASAGASDHHPQWYLNLEANPDTTVTLRRERRAVRARTATPEEKAQLWPWLVEQNRDWGDYAQQTDREIPVVLLQNTR